MRSLFTLTILVLLSYGFSQGRYQDRIRILFPKVHESVKYNEALWELTKSTNIDNPTVYAYKCLYYIVNAKYVFWANQKLETFRKGTAKLDKAILKYPKNADLRMVRYAVQKNAPKFLHYDKNTEEDKKILIAYQKRENKDEELNQLIIGVIKKYP